MAVDGPLYEHRRADPIRVGGSRGQLAGDEPTRMGHGPGSPRTVQLQAVPGEPPVRSGIASKKASPSPPPPPAPPPGAPRAPRRPPPLPSRSSKNLPRAVPKERRDSTHRVAELPH